jgi:hypothetical protein
MKQLAFFMTPFSSILEHANHLVFTGYGISTLVSLEVVFGLRSRLGSQRSCVPHELPGKGPVRVGHGTYYKKWTHTLTP